MNSAVGPVVEMTLLGGRSESWILPMGTED
jgi:hypothetical protein